MVKCEDCGEHLMVKCEDCGAYFIVKSDELGLSVERNRCFKLLALMPEQALSETQEDLQEIYAHYLQIAQSQEAVSRLSQPQRLRAAKVVETVET